LVLGLAAGLLAYQAWHLGLTADEPSHLAAAQQYWLGNDVLEPSDTPPLMRIVSGWIPVLLRAPVNHGTNAWATRDAYGIGAETLDSLHAAGARRLLFLMRLPFSIFPLGIVLLVWMWARELWGEWIALVLAACAVLEPTILGHGALIKSDVAAAFGALLFAYAAWRYWMRPAASRMWWMIAALLVALLAKFNLLALVPVAMVLVLIKGPRRVGALAVPVAVYVAIMASYEFRMRRIGREELDLFAPAGVPDILRTSNLVTELPWPKQFVRGVLYIAGAINNGSFRGWMLGHRIEDRALGYYPLALAIKMPIALQALLLAGLAALVVRIRRREANAADAFVWGSAAFYLGSAMFSNYHIGIRHVLPAIPFLILGGGFALERWRSRWAIAVLPGWLAVCSLWVYPQGISYFNEWIGGPSNGWRYLADSNVDWGQNYPELSEWLRRHPGARVRLYVFGLDSPNRYLPAGSWDIVPFPGSTDSTLPRRLVPTPGFYAVSANALDGITYARGWEDYLATFRDRRPIGRAGYSIFIYEVK
jgi:hypothetical protein